MSRHYPLFSKREIGIAVAFFAFIVCMIGVAVYGHMQMVKHCAAKNGHLESRNCHTSTHYVNHCSSNGSNCILTPETHTYCDELCIDNNNTNHVLSLD